MKIVLRRGDATCARPYRDLVLRVLLSDELLEVTAGTGGGGGGGARRGEREGDRGGGGDVAGAEGLRCPQRVSTAVSSLKRRGGGGGGRDEVSRDEAGCHLCIVDEGCVAGEWLCGCGHAWIMDGRRDAHCECQLAECTPLFSKQFGGRGVWGVF